MKAVQFGAGNIGRGFMGQLFYESGYEVVFIEVAPQLVKKINNDKKYPIKIVSQKSDNEIIVDNIRAVDGLNIEHVSNEIIDADIIATAVGVNVLSNIVKPLVIGLKKRWKLENYKPVNIIICENLLNANTYLFDLLSGDMNNEEIENLKKYVGLVEASIGRMAPIMTEEMQDGNILRVFVEEYCELPVDKDGFKGDIPEIKNMIPYSEFGFYSQRKLFIHNAGHAIIAYLGNIKNYEYIHECIIDKEIVDIYNNAMKNESGMALSLEYNISFNEIEDYIDDLLIRFGNKALCDTVSRVGRDTVRKLSLNDRLVGAAKLTYKHNIIPENLALGIAAGFLFKRTIDPSSLFLYELLKEKGIEKVITDICGLKYDDPLYSLIIKHYTLLTKK